jgi:cytochrome P450
MGSDTSAAVLVHVFYYLAQQPSIATKLREDLSSVYHPGSTTEVRNNQDAVYLNGVINEALRLHPPVPSGVLRQTPPEGLVLNGVFISGHVIVSSPSWSMGRRKSNCTTHLVAPS